MVVYWQEPILTRIAGMLRSAAIWAAYYQNVIKYTHDVIVKTKDVAGQKQSL